MRQIRRPDRPDRTLEDTDIEVWHALVGWPYNSPDPSRVAGRCTEAWIRRSYAYENTVGHEDDGWNPRLVTDEEIKSANVYNWENIRSLIGTFYLDKEQHSRRLKHDKDYILVLRQPLRECQGWRVYDAIRISARHLHDLCNIDDRWTKVSKDSGKLEARIPWNKIPYFVPTSGSIDWQYPDLDRRYPDDFTEKGEHRTEKGWFPGMDTYTRWGERIERIEGDMPVIDDVRELWMALTRLERRAHIQYVLDQPDYTTRDWHTLADRIAD